MKPAVIIYRKSIYSIMLFSHDWMRSIAQCLERLTSHATALGSIPASSDTCTAESERRHGR
jgi:hypothetical protein